MNSEGNSKLKFIIIGSVIVVAGVAAAVYLWWIRRRKNTVSSSSISKPTTQYASVKVSWPPNGRYLIRLNDGEVNQTKYSFFDTLYSSACQENFCSGVGYGPIFSSGGGRTVEFFAKDPTKGRIGETDLFLTPCLTCDPPKSTNALCYSHDDPLLDMSVYRKKLPSQADSEVSGPSYSDGQEPSEPVYIRFSDGSWLGANSSCYGASYKGLTMTTSKTETVPSDAVSVFLTKSIS